MTGLIQQLAMRRLWKKIFRFSMGRVVLASFSTEFTTMMGLHQTINASMTINSILMTLFFMSALRRELRRLPTDFRNHSWYQIRPYAVGMMTRWTIKRTTNFTQSSSGTWLTCVIALSKVVDDHVSLIHTLHTFSDRL
ncbi:hypothetical protein DPMN_193725 [Dreissena polymorpha]|uniref:Uncharacterized protein n=1 Tax=Dreissena polymorpha TaxID=45954 RepID=A0A9D3XY71_DREPO|nr:hypothetical protein DPMN_193725 [Dreissena polymorpha]